MHGVVMVMVMVVVVFDDLAYGSTLVVWRSSLHLRC